jgi:hypothetical protein
MHVAVISPTSLLKEVNTGRAMHMALAHKVLEGGFYRDFYEGVRPVYVGRGPDKGNRPKRPFIILDNSLMENGHKALDIRDVLEASQMIKADEIVLPDAFRDYEANLELFEESLTTFIERARANGYRPLPRIAGVVQGETRQEILDSFVFMFKNADTICIPKVLDVVWENGGRLGFINEISERYIFSRVGTTQSTRGKPLAMHLLGVWTSPFEICGIAKAWPNSFRSVDTALPVHAGIAGHQFHSRYGLEYFDQETATIIPANKAKRPENYLDMPRSDISEEMLYNIKYNIHVLDNYATGLEDVTYNPTREST